LPPLPCPLFPYYTIDSENKGMRARRRCIQALLRGLLLMKKAERVYYNLDLNKNIYLCGFEYEGGWG